MRKARLKPHRPPARQLHTRPPLDRMVQIFKAIKADGCPNRHRLAADIEVTTKTIQRDIDFMRERMHMPIAFDRGQGGYRFTEPVPNFPMIELSEGELISVFIGQKALLQYKGTPFEAPLRSALEKLTSNLPGSLTMSWSDLDSMISFRSFRISPMDLTVFRDASEAVRRRQEISFEYKKFNFLRYEHRLVQPLHIACVLDQWYLIGRCLLRDDMRSFVLARIRNTRLTATRFKRPADFSIEEHLSGSFGIFRAKGAHTIRLRFDKFGAQLVRERIWHPSQKIQELSGGGLEITLRLSSFHEIEQWILSWGEHVQVLSPAQLKKVIARRLKTALAGIPA